MNTTEIKSSNSPENGVEYKLVEFHDYFHNQKNKKSALKNYGEKNAQLHSFFFDYLKGYNIPVSFIQKEEKKILKFLKTEDFSFRIRMLNSADSRTAKIFNVKVGFPLQLPVFENHFGDSKDSLVSESHLISFNLCTYDELKFINRLCTKLNAILKSFFERRNALLVELTCIFGKFDGKINLVGDFSPFSFKVIGNENTGNLPDPYMNETPAQVKKYTDYLLNLTNGD